MLIYRLEALEGFLVYLQDTKTFFSHFEKEFSHYSRIFIFFCCCSQYPREREEKTSFFGNVFWLLWWCRISHNGPNKAAFHWVASTVLDLMQARTASHISQRWEREERERKKEREKERTIQPMGKCWGRSLLCVPYFAYDKTVIKTYLEQMRVWRSNMYYASIKI